MLLNYCCRRISRKYSTTKTLSNSLNARLNYDFMISNVHLLEKNIEQRKVSGNPQKVVQLNQIYRDTLAKVEERRRERNEWSAKIPTLQGNEKMQAVHQAKILKAELQSLEIELREAKMNLQKEALLIPNITHSDTPVGPEENAIELKTFGERRTFGPAFNNGTGKPKNHMEICQQHDLLDFEGGTNIAGPKFAVLRGDLALLEIGLISWTMSMLSSRGFMPTLVPDVCKVEMIEACGFNPRGPESQVYTIHENNNDNKNYLGLIGTAEIPLAGLALNQTFETNELPFRTVGFSHAFRREAGSRGAQSKGLYRLHQFSKVEMFIHCTHNQADNELQNMIDIQCDLLNQLGLHGRVLQMPTEELGASAHRKLDVEVWMPGRNEYGEVCSASDCTDYQSRRLNTQYIDRSEKSKKKQFVSTLNATAMAIPRVMLAILETHQVEDGTVKVPAPMIPFIGKDTIGVVEEQN